MQQHSAAVVARHRHAGTPGPAALHRASNTRSDHTPNKTARRPGGSDFMSPAAQPAELSVQKLHPGTCVAHAAEQWHSDQPVLAAPAPPAMTLPMQASAPAPPRVSRYTRLNVDTPTSHGAAAALHVCHHTALADIYLLTASCPGDADGCRHPTWAPHMDSCLLRSGGMWLCVS
jgi:hypothetical protein